MNISKSNKTLCLEFVRFYFIFCKKLKDNPGKTSCLIFSILKNVRIRLGRGDMKAFVRHTKGGSKFSVCYVIFHF